MLASVYKSLARRFGRRYQYDTGYLADVIDASPAAFIKLSLTRGMTRRPGWMPAEPYFAVMLRAVLFEDCGPCTQLVVNFGVEAGVAPERIRAIVARDLDVLPPDTAAAVRFADAVLARDPHAGEARAAVRHRWGERGLIAFGLAMCGARVFPAFKYAIGHGEACQRVTVGDVSLAPQGVAA